MRFQVSQVMDAIEQRLTTDITGAQAVVDLGQVVRHVALDDGRPVNLVRIGMVADALSRYLRDGGAMLYAVASRSLMSEAAFTSKEKMVLSRWADDGLIEVVAETRDRAAEVADLTGLPLIVLRHDPALAAAYGWPDAGQGRMLQLVPRCGIAVLSPIESPALRRAEAGSVNGAVVGRAKVPPPETAAVPAGPAAAASPNGSGPADGGAADGGPSEEGSGSGEPAAPAAAEPPAAVPAASEASAGAAEPADAGAAEPADPGGADEPADTGGADEPTDGAEPAEVADADEPADGDGAADPADAAGAHEPTGEEGTDESAEAPEPAPEPAAVESAVVEPAAVEPAVVEPAAVEPAAVEPAAVEPSADEPAAGEPAAEQLSAAAPARAFADRDPAAAARVRVSRNRDLRAAPSPAGAKVTSRQWRCGGFDCPAFGEHRQIGQPVPRMRGTVAHCPRHDEPLTDIGPRPAAYPVSIVVDDLARRRLVVREGQPVAVGREEDDPAVVSVAPWLHRAAANWISRQHVRLEAGPDGLVVSDLSRHGTVIWQRRAPDDPGTTRTLRRQSCTLGEWDSVELYTGIELVRGDRQLATVLGRDEPVSVLIDAPTAAHRQIRQADRVGSGG